MDKDTISIDVDTMRRNANKYFIEGRSCAQITLLGICSVVGSPMTEEEIIAITAGLTGGLGNTYDEGTCGALTSGVMFIGMHYGHRQDRGLNGKRELGRDGNI